MASNSTEKDCLSKSSDHKDDAEEQVECMLAINMEHSRNVVSIPGFYLLGAEGKLPPNVSASPRKFS